MICTADVDAPWFTSLFIKLELVWCKGLDIKIVKQL